MKNLWVFGCSFSSKHLYIKDEHLYGNLISKELGLNLINTAAAGNSNDKLFYDLCDNIDKIKDGDIIIYQFSSFDRIGYFVNNDICNYFSSAGIPQIEIGVKRKQWPFNQYTMDELTTLIEYIYTWQPMKSRFLFDSPIKILNFLEKTKNIKFIITYMTADYTKFDKHTLILPLNTNINNVSINDFLIENHATVGHEFIDINKSDSHPGIIGHQLLKEMLLKEINKLHNLI